VNPFIRALKESGDFSEARLKALFRKASKKAHPDIARSDGKAFVKLKREYEEALAYLRENASGPKEKPTPECARRALLKNLQLFTMKVFTKRADPVLDAMVEAAADYDPALSALLGRYRQELYRSHDQWSNDANLYYAHSVFISGARQLFLFYDNGPGLHKTLVLRYREAMDGWTRKLDPEFTEILSSLYDWIESELDKEPVPSGI
jgi:hypothetical protein